MKNITTEATFTFGSQEHRIVFALPLDLRREVSEGHIAATIFEGHEKDPIFEAINYLWNMYLYTQGEAPDVLCLPSKRVRWDSAKWPEASMEAKIEKKQARKKGQKNAKST